MFCDFRNSFIKVYYQYKSTYMLSMQKNYCIGDLWEIMMMMYDALECINPLKNDRIS